jgi:hypothetical protein
MAQEASKVPGKFWFYLLKGLYGLRIETVYGATWEFVMDGDLVTPEFVFVQGEPVHVEIH